MPAGTAPPHDPDALLDRALDCMAAGDAQGAIPRLEQILAQTPGHRAAAHALLRALEDSDRVDDALAVTRDLIAADPDDPLLHTRLSILLQKTQDIPAAEAASARARVLEWKRQLRSSTVGEGAGEF